MRRCYCFRSLALIYRRWQEKTSGRFNSLTRRNLLVLHMVWLTALCKLVVLLVAHKKLRIFLYTGWSCLGYLILHCSYTCEINQQNLSETPKNVYMQYIYSLICRGWLLNIFISFYQTLVILAKKARVLE